MCIEAIEAVIRHSEQVGPRYQLLWVIAWHINRDSGDWPLTIREMANEAHIGMRQIYYHLADLEASGELAIKRRAGQRSLYRLAYFSGITELVDELSTTPAEIRTPAENNTCRNPQGQGAGTRRGGGADFRRGVLYIPDSLPESRPEGLPSPVFSPQTAPLRPGAFVAWQMEQQRLAAERKAQ